MELVLLFFISIKTLSLNCPFSITTILRVFLYCVKSESESESDSHSRRIVDDGNELMKEGRKEVVVWVLWKKRRPP